MAWKKRERGRQLNWVRLDIAFDWAAKRLVLCIPADRVQEPVAEAPEVGRPIIGMERLGTLLGTLSLVAGVVTRLRLGGRGSSLSGYNWYFQGSEDG